LVGRVEAVEGAAAAAGPWTLVHGDASTRNVRTGADGVVALLDWEDVSAAPGVSDLAWLLVSSVEPDRWDRVVHAYGEAGGRSTDLPVALGAAVVQGILSLADAPVGSAEATGWIARLEAAAAVRPL
jgi:aminoglycoside phosphotransferase (APT) family kinase protein